MMLCDSLAADHISGGRPWKSLISTSVSLATPDVKKGALILHRMVSKKTTRLHALAENRAEEVKLCRWMNNRNIRREWLIEGLSRRAAAAATGRHVLVLQDTTEINYQRHAGRVRDLGPVGNGTDVGLFFHPQLAIDADSGHCLGLVGAEVWTRSPSQVTTKRRRAFEEKESHRWVRGGERAKEVLATAARVTLIDDREGDIYLKWVALPGPGFDLLTRAAQDRTLANGRRLFKYLGRRPVAHRYRLIVPRRPGVPAREVTVELRIASVTLRRPKSLLAREAPPSVTLQAVEVREVGRRRKDVNRLHWRLLTTHAIPDVAAALQIIDWYRDRWNIEQFFWTMKRQGLDIESCQLETFDALSKMVILAAEVASRITQLVRARDGHDPRPASDLFDPGEIEVIAALQDELQGRTEKQKNPFAPGSLAWAAWTIGRLGGWKGYPSESPAGPITMKRGLIRLEALTHGYHLAKSVQR